MSTNKTPTPESLLSLPLTLLTAAGCSRGQAETYFANSTMGKQSSGQRVCLLQKSAARDRSCFIDLAEACAAPFQR